MQSIFVVKKAHLDLLSKFLDMMSLDQYLAAKDEGKVIYNPSNDIISGNFDSEMTLIVQARLF
jgi:hypothetical protein